MNDFKVSWLDLRENADVRARSIGVVGSIRAQLKQFEKINVLDLGSGTAAMFRYLAPKLNSRQTWKLIDMSQDLLQQCAPRFVAWADSQNLTLREDENYWEFLGKEEHYVVSGERKNLAAGFDDFASWNEVHLVTASALLDLVSFRWIEELAQFCGQTHAIFYANLTYDGKVLWLPTHPTDAECLRLFNEDQRRDKGFGLALGPYSSSVIVRALTSLGFSVNTSPSPWVLGPNDHILQGEMLAQWIKVLEQTDQRLPATFQDWMSFRSRAIREGRSHLMVGHQDICAVPSMLA